MRIVKLLNCYIVKLIVGSEDGKMRGYQRGQVLIISLLVLVVALTVGLSVAVRTITTTRMTAAEDTSQRAFSAAEAGLERALTAGVDFSSVPLSNNSSYSTSTSQLSGDEILVDNGALIDKDDPVDVWLSSYPNYANPWPPGVAPGVPSPQSLRIYWVSNVDSNNCASAVEYQSPAALEVITITGSAASPIINHYAFDPCSARRNNNNFTLVSLGSGATVSGKVFNYGASITFTAASPGLLVRIVPLYASTHIGIRGTGLPPQGTVITSTGCSGGTGTGCSGGTQRKIVSFRGYPKAPVELYPFLIFSPK